MKDAIINIVIIFGAFLLCFFAVFFCGKITSRVQNGDMECSGEYILSSTSTDADCEIIYSTQYENINDEVEESDNQYICNPNINSIIIEYIAGTDAPVVNDAQTYNEIPEEYHINNFKPIFQYPELPTGCEITALTMVINYFGFDVDKVTMAEDFLPKVNTSDQYYGDDGVLYGVDIYSFFLGDPFDERGLACGAAALVTAADEYFREENIDYEAVLLEESEPEELYKWVSMGYPVVFGGTLEMRDREEEYGWYTEDNEYVSWSSNDHGLVLIGYDKENVTVADPIYGIYECTKEQFEKVYISKGMQAMTVQQKKCDN